jgi:cell division protein FtsZ
VVEKLLTHPLLDEGRALAESDAVLVSLMGGRDLTMAEVGRVMEQISRHCERAQVIMGAAVDEAFKTRLSVTIIAAKQTGIMPAMAGDLTEPMISRGSGRSGSRCVPPAASLTPEQREQVLARHASGRGRKAAARMRQAQLPLAIISKGRFDKSEPTIHKGEDLDIPTYIRRGVALN